MRIIFTAKSSEEAIRNLREIGVDQKIVLHRMPKCKHTFEALIGDGANAV